jgi:hypothetical protein
MKKKAPEGKYIPFKKEDLEGVDGIENQMILELEI